MSKNKSEELCKLLGIKPKHYDYYEACESPTEDDHVVFDEYPDFTKPNNFVKIMSLAHKYDSLSSLIIINYKKGDVVQEVFVDLIIQDLADESYKEEWAETYIEVRNKFMLKAQ